MAWLLAGLIPESWIPARGATNDARLAARGVIVENAVNSDRRIAYRRDKSSFTPKPIQFRVSSTGVEQAANASGFEELPPAQLKVLVLLRNGKPSKEMASLMSITEATIKAHLTEIFRKLKEKNRTQAVVAAKDLDLPDVNMLDEQ